MNQIFEWLKSKFSSHSVEADEDHTLLGVGAQENVKAENSDGDFVTTLPIRTSPVESSYIVVESRAFDPYDTGSFDMSKSPFNK